MYFLQAAFSNEYFEFELFAYILTIFIVLKRIKSYLDLRYTEKIFSYLLNRDLQNHQDWLQLSRKLRYDVINDNELLKLQFKTIKALEIKREVSLLRHLSIKDNFLFIKFKFNRGRVLEGLYQKSLEGRKLYLKKLYGDERNINLIESPATVSPKILR